MFNNHQDVELNKIQVNPNEVLVVKIDIDKFDCDEAN
jgi:hypothetical protein